MIETNADIFKYRKGDYITKTFKATMEMPHYINPKHLRKKVTREELLAALREVNEKNRVFRREMIISNAATFRDGFVCVPREFQ